MFLFAYGYAIQDNEDDAVAVKLMQNATSQGNEGSQQGGTEVGTFYVRAGGAEGIPEVSRRN